MTKEESIPCKFIKLNNGENIVCVVESSNCSENQIKIMHPLKMQIMPRMLTGAQSDSIGLSHWISPMTEDVSFKIYLKDILLISNASPGLIKYYEYALTQIYNNNNNLMNLDDMDDESHDDLLNDLPEPSKLIH
jgi:hypothetical protein